MPTCPSCAPARKPPGPLRVSHQNLPAVRYQLVVHEAGAVHRLDHAPGQLALRADACSEATQTVAVCWRRESINQLALLGDHAHIHTPAAQIQTKFSMLSSFPRGRPKRPDTYRGRWSVLCFGWPDRASGCNRARRPYAVRDGGPTFLPGGYRRLEARPPSSLFLS